MMPGGQPVEHRRRPGGPSRPQQRLSLRSRGLALSGRGRTGVSFGIKLVPGQGLNVGGVAAGGGGEGGGDQAGGVEAADRKSARSGTVATAWALTAGSRPPEWA
jgi:hypothetical protein